MKKTYLQPSTAYELIEAEEMIATSELSVPDSGGDVKVDSETTIAASLEAEIRAMFLLSD